MKRTAMLTMALMAILATSAAGQEVSAAPLACSNDLDGVKTFAPTWARVGATIAPEMRVNDDHNVASIANPTATLDGEPTPFQLQTSSKVLVQAPSDPGLAELVFDWDQDLLTPTACHGRDRYDITIVEKNAKVGDPAMRRLEGRYRIQYKAYGGAAHYSPSTWSLKPSCDYFGCTTRLRWGDGSRATVLPHDDGTYRHSETGDDQGICSTENLATGAVKTANPAYNVVIRTTIVVRTTRNGIAATFTGKRTEEYSPNTDARRIGCDGDHSAEWKISGRRR